MQKSDLTSKYVARYLNKSIHTLQQKTNKKMISNVQSVQTMQKSLRKVSLLSLKNWEKACRQEEQVFEIFKEFLDIVENAKSPNYHLLSQELQNFQVIFSVNLSK